MKDLQYITHDLGARNDPKLLDVQMEMGGQGLAIFWCLVEMLWENDGRMPMNFRAIAFSLRWATAEEVERVIRDFGLFEDDGKEFWSRSALERIAQKKDRIQARSEAARNAGQASARARQNNRATPVEQPLNERTTPVEPINKDINKEKKKERNINNSPLTAADFFEIFFFENVKDPAGEAARFVKYYEERGWTYQDGTPVTDPERAAKDWKPAKAGARWDSEALRWYQAVWNAAKSRIPEARYVFLESLRNITREDQKLALRFKDADTAQYVAAFIIENDLAGDWKIDYRIEN